MIEQIIQAVSNEAKQFLNAQTDDRFKGGTCVFVTDWRPNQVAEQMPLVLLDMTDSPEASQYLGGVTRMDWVFNLNAYSTMPDSYNDNVEDPYATSLMAIIDLIREHFSTAQAIGADQLGVDGGWLTQEMIDITNDFGFKFTLSGVVRADALPYKTGWIKGYRVVMDSVAVQVKTDYAQPSAQVLENVVQIGSTEENELFIPYFNFKNLLIVANTEHTFPKNTFVATISMQTAAGSPPPTIRIGLTPGGDEIMADAAPGLFYLVRPEYYCNAETTFYFTMTGIGIINTTMNTLRNYLPKLVNV
jgi:hypothetical protein